MSRTKSNEAEKTDRKIKTIELESASERETKTRKQKRKEKVTKKRKMRIRLIPIWLRLLIVLFLFAASLVAGAMFGYGVIGKGDPLDVFHKQTWQHPFDVIFKKLNP